MGKSGIECKFKSVKSSLVTHGRNLLTAGFLRKPTFNLSDDIPKLGTDLLHVGSLLGQMGANSMTDGIYSQHGRLIGINKFVFDQTTVNAFPGSSGHYLPF